MGSVRPVLRSCVVGALTCQRDSYLRTLDTEVVSCIKLSSRKVDQPIKAKTKAIECSTNTKQQWLIEFADSVLFPEGTSLHLHLFIPLLFLANDLSGGGQPSDYGTIAPLTDPSSEPIRITFVQRQGLHCVYHSPQPLPPGTLVHQEVDFRRRWDHMQQHTGQHLLSAIMDRYDNLETLGWGMGSGNDMSYVDVPRRPSEVEMQSIQEKCNDAIQKNLRITVENSDEAKVDKLPGDYDKERGVIRVVKIGNLDTNTYVGSISDIFIS